MIDHHDFVVRIGPSGDPGEEIRVQYYQRYLQVDDNRDPKFHLADTARFLQSLHAHHVSEVSDD